MALVLSVNMSGKMEHDKRLILYPHYITASKTVAEGRRIPKPLACENPNTMEMFDCCKYLKVPAEVEDKHYPRDWFIRGRLRVQLRGADGALVNPEIPDRRTLLIKISELVPKHPSRGKRSQTAAPGTGNLMEAFSAAEAAAAAAAASGVGASGSSSAKAAAPAASGGSSKSNKKKGKK